MAFLPQDLTLWILLVAPGLIAVQLAIWIGVVETTLTDSRMLVASLVSSIVIDTLFFGLYQVVYGPIDQLDTAESIFFTPQFRPGLVLALVGLSILVGLVYAFLIIHDVTGRLRHLAWSDKDLFRYPGQPWEGTLADADIVRIDTVDDEIVIGRVGDYSRLDKPKEVVLRYPQWWDPSQGYLVDENDDAVLFRENEIRRITVRSRVGWLWYRETGEIAEKLLWTCRDYNRVSNQPEADPETSARELQQQILSIGERLREHATEDPERKPKVTTLLTRIEQSLRSVRRDGIESRAEELEELSEELVQLCAD